MKKKLLMLILVLSLAFNAAVISALVYHFWIGRGRPFSDTLPNQVLRLDPRQSELINALRDELEKETYSIRSRIYASRRELFELLQADPPDSGSINAKIDEINALQRSMQMTVVDYMLREKELLDGEQRYIFWEQMREKMCPEAGPEAMGPLLGRCHQAGRWGSRGR